MVLQPNGETESQVTQRVSTPKSQLASSKSMQFPGCPRLRRQESRHWFMLFVLYILDAWEGLCLGWAVGVGSFTWHKAPTG